MKGITFNLFTLFILFFSSNVLAINHLDSVNVNINNVEDSHLKIDNLLLTSKKHDAVSKEAQQAASEALALAQLAKDTQRELKAFLQLASIYEKRLDTEKSLNYLFNALKISEQNQKKDQIAITYQAIARNYLFIEEFDKTVKYAKLGLEYFNSIKDRIGIATSHLILGESFEKQKNHQSALKHFFIVKNYNKVIKDDQIIIQTNLSIGDIYIKQNRYAEARKLLSEAYQLSLNEEDVIMKIRSLQLLADAEIHLDMFSEAETKLASSLSMANKINKHHLIAKSHQLYSVYYERKDLVSKALESHKTYLFHALKATELSKITAIEKLEAKHELEKKIKDNEILRKDNEIKNLELVEIHNDLDQQSLILSLFGVIIIFSIVIVYFQYKNIKNRKHINTKLRVLNDEIIHKSDELQNAYDKIQNWNATLEQKIDARTQELKNANKEINTLFYRTSHDFRTPLTSILGLIKVAELSFGHIKNLDEVLMHMKESVKHLDNKMSKIRTLSLVERKKLVELSPSLMNILQKKELKFEEQLDKKEIHFSYNIDANIHLFTDLNILSSAIDHLIENAIDYAKPSLGTINIDVSIKDHFLQIEVKDNGLGIDEKLQNQIFDMYFRGNKDSKGHGLGLYIAKKLVQKLQGEISCESVLNLGTSMTIKIPIEHNSFDLSVTKNYKQQLN